MPDLHLRTHSNDAHRTSRIQSTQEGGRRRDRRRRRLGPSRLDRSRLSEMRTPQGLLPSDANTFSRRAHDDFLPMRLLLSPMEGKLVLLLLLLTLTTTASAERPFSVVLFMCVWQRPLLTDFILGHYARMRGALSRRGIELTLFVAGSDNSTTPALASRHGARFVVVPNRPVGAKHNNGLRAIRTQLGPKGADAVAIVGSDDLINMQFFERVRELMQSGPDRMHAVGLRDIYFFDLATDRMMYTEGYKQLRTPVSGTVGCGRVFSWPLLDTLNWELWDWDRDRSLDQSAIRRVLSVVPQIADISAAFSGLDDGIIAIDIKSDGFEQGRNIWRFDEVLKGGAKDGPFHEFRDRHAEKTIDSLFGFGFYERRIVLLRERMKRNEMVMQ